MCEFSLFFAGNVALALQVMCGIAWKAVEFKGIYMMVGCHYDVIGFN